MRNGGPHGVELTFAATLVFILCVAKVGAHAGRGHTEANTRATIELWVDRDRQSLSVARAIAAREVANDAFWLLAIHPCTDIERLIVVHEEHHGAFCGRGTRHRTLLAEVVDGSGGLPHLVGQLSVDLDDTGRALCFGDFGRWLTTNDAGNHTSQDERAEEKVPKA